MTKVKISIGDETEIWGEIYGHFICVNRERIRDHKVNRCCTAVHKILESGVSISHATLHPGSMRHLSMFLELWMMPWLAPTVCILRHLPQIHMFEGSVAPRPQLSDNASRFRREHYGLMDAL